jgi:hypothetical protein
VAGGAFVTAEGAYHRIVPVDKYFGKALAERKSTALLGVEAGYELSSGRLLGVQLAYLDFQLGHSAYYPGGRLRSTVRYLPILGTLGLRFSLGKRAGLLLTTGGGLAREWQASPLDPRRFNRSYWRPVFRVSVGIEHTGDRMSAGVRVGWLSLPSVVIPQVLEKEAFGGLGVSGTLTFGRGTCGPQRQSQAPTHSR